jgi:hypothetical protein
MQWPLPVSQPCSTVQPSPSVQSSLLEQPLVAQPFVASQYFPASHALLRGVCTHCVSVHTSSVQLTLSSQS